MLSTSRSGGARRSRSVSAASCFLAAFTGIAFVGCTSPDGGTRLPNVLVVSIDSLRADHVHSYGYARQTTPRIDALAKDGVLFETAVSSSSWTLPAHVTLFTSTPATEHGVQLARHRMTNEAVTLPEVLRGAGYATAGFVSGPTVRKLYGFDQGFGLYDDETVMPRSRRRSNVGTSSPVLVRLVNDWLGDWNAGGRMKPFFVFLHMWDVHYDYAPPPPYDTLFDPDYEGDLTSQNFEGNPRLHPRMPSHDLEHLIALYDGEIRFVDEHLGMLLEELDRLGIRDDTIVAVLSDHGDEFFEHGQKGHAHSLYDESILVPFVIRYPRRVPPGQRIEQQVRLMDVAPTILGLAGVAIPPEFGSRTRLRGHRYHDLTPWITRQDGGPFPSLVALSDLVGAMGQRRSSVRTATLKLVELEGRENRTELFRLNEDPLERVDLANTVSEQGITRRLAAARSDFRRSVSADRLARPARLDDEQVERLRALGYVN